jgi:hypothetical protein
MVLVAGTIRLPQAGSPAQGRLEATQWVAMLTLLTLLNLLSWAASVNQAVGVCPIPRVRRVTVLKSRGQRTSLPSLPIIEKSTNPDPVRPF